MQDDDIIVIAVPQYHALLVAMYEQESQNHLCIIIAQFHEVIVRRDVRHHVTLPTSSVVTMVTTGMKLQLCLFLLS